MAFVLALPGRGSSQTSAEIFEQAREAAFSGQREEAKALARELLERNPDNPDARILLGRVHTWDGEFEEAREHLTIVLETRPTYTDARRALVDVELRSGNAEEALRQTEIGLQHAPGDTPLLVRRADALRLMGEFAEAEAQAQEIVLEEPGNEEALSVLSRIQNRPRDHRLRVKYTFERFNTFSEDWHETSVAISKRGERGSVTLRTNLARRFADDGAQFEIDAYPSLVPGMYGYVNFAHSSASFFPSTRYGAELHVGLPQGFEVSGGLRHLRFDASNVTVYTGSLTKYEGTWFLSGRTYITPREGDNTSVSGQLTARYYMGDRYNFVGLTVGLGSAPDVDDITAVQIQRLDSKSIRLESEIPVARLFEISVNGGYRVEELPGDRTRYHAVLGTGFGLRF